MDITKKSRADLKRFFVKNAIPTESNFADLIEAPINQKDDGLVKTAGDALNVEAAMTTKVAIRLYESFADTNAAWTLGVQDNSSTTATAPTPLKGFTLADAAGNTRLFVNGQTGTVSAAALTVSGAVNAGTLSASGTLTAMSSLTATGLITATGGLTVAPTKTLTADLVTANGLITARAGLSVPAGQSVTVGSISLTTPAPSSFNPNPALGVSGPVSVPAGLTTGALAATGSVSATMGLTVTGAPLTVGGAGSGAAQPLTVYGLTTANGGLTVGANQTLAADTLTSTTTDSSGGGTIRIASGRALVSNALTAGGPVTASAGLTVTGAAVNVGTSGSTQPLNVSGLLTANGGVNIPNTQTLSVGGLLTATGGIAVPVATSLTLGNLSLFAGPQFLNVQGGGLSVNGLLNASGLVTASGGLTVAANQTLTAGVVNASGLVSASAGLTVAANQTLSAGIINASGLVTSSGGLTVPSGRALYSPGALTAISSARAGLHLDKTLSQHVALPSIPAAIPFNNGFTVQAWIYVSSFDHFARIIDFGSGQQLENIIVFLQSDFSFGAQGFKGVVGGLGVKTSPGSLSLNTWTHVAVTMDTAGVMKFYKNGILLQTTYTSTASVPNALLRTNNYLGRSNWQQDPYWNGWLSEVSVFTGVQSVSMNPLSGREPGLVGYWKLDNLVAPYAQALDSCTNSPSIGSGTVVNGATITDPSPARTALRLDGSSSQHIILPTIPSTFRFDTGFTVQAWVNLSSFDIYARIIDFSNGQANDNIIVYILNDGSFAAQSYKGSVPGTSVDIKTSANTLALNTWTHVAVTSDSSGLVKFYKNGLLLQTTSTTGANVPNAVQRTSNFIGRSNWSSNPFFNGWLSEVSVFTGVQSITMNPLSGRETGLVGYWKLDGLASGSVGTVVDSCLNSFRIGDGVRANGAQIWDQRDTRAQVTIVQEDWSGAVLQSSWLPHRGPGWNPPGFFKDSSGVVHLRGLVDNTSPSTIVEAPGTNSLILTLPPGYRPDYRHLFACMAGNAVARVDVGPSGDVFLVAGNSTWVSLDNISFRAAL